MRIDIEEISVKNFLSYGNVVTTFKLDKDFFTIITGENGNGKSTLVVEAIHFAFFGKTLRRIKKDEIVNNINKKNCVVTVKFFQNNKTKYLIERGLYPDFIKITNLNTDEILDSRSAKKLVQQEIEKILGFDQLTLKNISVLAINNSKPFIDLTAEETRTIVENLLGIQIFSVMLDEVKKQIKNEKEILEINKKDITLYKQLVEEQNEKLKRYEELKQNFEKERQDRIKILNEQLELKQHNLKDKTIEKEQVIIDVEPIQPILKTIETISTVKVDKEINTISQLVNKISSEDKSIGMREENEGLIKQYKQETKLIENKINEKNILIAQSNQDIKVHKNNIIKHNEDIEYLKTTEYCPRCKSTLTEVHRNLEIQKLEDGINKENISISLCNKNIKDYEDEISLFSLDKDLIVSKEIKSNKIYHDTLVELNEKKQKDLVKLNEKLQLKQEEKNTIIKEHSLLQEKENKKYNEELDIYHISLARRQEQLNKITTISNNIDILNIDILAVKEKITDNECDSLDKHIGDLVDIKKVEEYQTKYNSLFKEKDDVIEKLKYHELMKNILSDSGVKSNIIKKDIPYLNKSINYYLNTFEKDFGVEFDEEFNIVLKSFNKRNLSYNNLSEGEKKRVDLAILLSFIDLTRKKNSVNLNILVLDECLDTSLDNIGQKQLIKILQSKIDSGAIKSIFIISHDPNIEIENAAKVEIINEGGFSKIKES